MPKILLVEDEATLSTTIAYNLRKAGYDVRSAADGEAALRLAAHDPPELVLLDVMLPTIDGFEVCRQLRRTSSVPILMLTARDDEVDRVVGLEIGADDYMTKPFSMRELLARVKALLRRRDMLQQELITAGPIHSRAISAGELLIDPGAYRVTRRGQEVVLKPKEIELLLYLARNRGQACSNRQILESVWGYDYFGDARTVAVHVHGLREKLEDDPRNPRLIETVRGIGYRFTG